MQGFISFDLISEEALSTFPFSRMGVGVTMCADGQIRFIFIFSLCKFSTLWQGNSENSITVTHNSILKFYFANLQYSNKIDTVFF